MLLINSDNLVTLSSLTDEQTGAVIDDATVSGRLLELDETEIYTFTLDYVASSSGDYQAIIPAIKTEDLTPGQSYIVEIVAVSDGGTFTDRRTLVADYASE